MAYIELVDSPKEIGKRREKNPKTYPKLEELIEKAPTMDIYEKPVIHVSENKKTALLGGIGLLLTKLRTLPVPKAVAYVNKTYRPPNVTDEFRNLPGKGNPHAAFFTPEGAPKTKDEVAGKVKPAEAKGKEEKKEVKKEEVKKEEKPKQAKA